MRRIVCIGNRYVAQDSAGPRVYDLLCRRPLPEGVEVIDGGIAGLGLLRLADGAERLVFVDAVLGMGTGETVAEIDAAQVEGLAQGTLDHAAGLPYLLRALPIACDGPVPEVKVVGVAGAADPKALEMAATLALRLAVGPRSG